VTVTVTDECPDAGHCNGQRNHLDLSTRAFQAIGNTQAGVINIRFRQMDCAPNTNAKLVIKSGSSRWHLECAVKDLAGVGALMRLEVRTAQLGQWTELSFYYGQFFQRTEDMGEGPYEFRITSQDMQVITHTIDSATLPTGEIDLGTNLVAGAGVETFTGASHGAHGVHSVAVLAAAAGLLAAATHAILSGATLLGL
jgi:expansin (peptidoglycan-binding protein)